jgi:hypothetical protein
MIKAKKPAHSLGFMALPNVSQNSEATRFQNLSLSYNSGDKPAHWTLNQQDTAKNSNFFPREYTDNNSSAQWIGGWPQQLIPYAPSPFTPATQSPPQKAVETKPNYKPEELHGRFCAYVIATIGDKEYTGILFVKKCGYWKILEYNGHKLVGGGAGTFEDMLRSGELKLSVILTIYDADRIEKNGDEMDLEIS